VSPIQKLNLLLPCVKQSKKLASPSPLKHIENGQSETTNHRRKPYFIAMGLGQPRSMRSKTRFALVNNKPNELIPSSILLVHLNWKDFLHQKRR
jgi:hypothetical protein